MNEIKEILSKLWKAIIKLALSKTALDEKIAEKVNDLNEKVKSMDEIDNKEEVKEEK
jgi:hypothetical protein